MGVEEIGDLPLWAHLAIWVPLTTVFTLALLQPIKGATIGLQWPCACTASAAKTRRRTTDRHGRTRPDQTRHP